MSILQKSLLLHLLIFVIFLNSYVLSLLIRRLLFQSADKYSSIFTVLIIQSLFILHVWFLLHIYSSKLRRTNVLKRQKIFAELGYSEGDAKLKNTVGFFHPYW